MIRFLLISLICLLGTNIQAQSELGQWSEHLPFSNAVKLVKAGPLVFCGTQSGLFEYDSESYLITEWSKVNGLSGVNISTMAYSDDHKTLIIGYSDSNIDLLVNRNEVINIPDIKSKQMTGSKRINSITVHEDQAFLSCGFGIVVINLVKGEISTTYYIGDDGDQLEVFETEIFNHDSIFAATASGIKKAFLYDPKLENYRFWEKVVGLPHATDTYHHLAYTDGLLFAAHQSPTNTGDSIFIYDGHHWEPFPWYYKDIRDLKFAQGKLLTVSEFQVNLMDLEENRLWHLTSYGFDYLRIQDALLDDDGTLWMADQLYGLLKTTDRVEFDQIRPDGPWDRKAFDVAISDGDLWIAAGGYDGAWNNLWNFSGLSFNHNGSWKAFTPLTHESLDKVRDIVRIVPNPANSSQVYAATWGYGLLEFQDGELFEIHNDENTDGAITSIYPGKAYVRIGGMAFDSQNNLWVTNSGVPNPISVRKTDGSWKSFPYGVFLGDAFAGEMVITKSDGAYDEVKWVQLPKGNGLFAFYTGDDIDDTSDDRHKEVTVRALWPPNTVKVRNNIYSMAVDRNNELWLGTSGGAIVYHAPNQVFDTNSASFVAGQPGVDEGDEYYHALLETETVTAIAVDGANRKWFGTRNSGVFLTDDEGEHIIKSFNILNSPLLSNNILSIAIDQKNGEIYFGTEAGVVSYRSDAIEDLGNETQIYAFPNPVRPDYNGPITIRGIAEYSIVKITDINGNLVYQTESLGGQAVWNGKDLEGNEVHSGVYMVFSSTAQTERKSVAKILFVR